MSKDIIAYAIIAALGLLAAFLIAREHINEKRRELNRQIAFAREMKPLADEHLALRREIQDRLFGNLPSVIAMQTGPAGTGTMREGS